jgi:hypothetical protein
MTNETRRCVAVIAYMMIVGRGACSVFDYTLGGYYNMGCTFSGNYISLFDYRRSCYISGYLPNLFDYSTASYINLRRGTNTVDGYAYHTASYLNVTINGSSVTIFDYQMSRYYMYSVA